MAGIRSPRSLRRVAVGFVTAAAVVAVPVLVVEPIRVASASMTPTLHEGDHVLIDKIGMRHMRRRDIVAFHEDGSPELFVKRVVGVAGDTVGVEDGVLVVDHEQVREPFVRHSEVDSTYFGPVRVPSGTVFVLGDNRANSIDSRTFGPVRLDRVVGVVLCVVWPG